jgi:hypothetical protein
VWLCWLYLFALRRKKTNVFCGINGEGRMMLGLPFSTFAGSLLYVYLIRLVTNHRLLDDYMQSRVLD